MASHSCLISLQFLVLQVHKSTMASRFAGCQIKADKASNSKYTASPVQELTPAPAPSTRPASLAARPRRQSPPACAWPPCALYQRLLPLLLLLLVLLLVHLVPVHQVPLARLTHCCQLQHCPPHQALQQSVLARLRAHPPLLLLACVALPLQAVRAGEAVWRAEVVPGARSLVPPQGSQMAAECAVPLVVVLLAMEQVAWERARR